MIRFLLVVGLLLRFGIDAAAFDVTIRTTEGETTFFAPPGDTLSFRVDVDSEGESLTGVELFIRLDSRFFHVMDASPDPGTQPGNSVGLLGDVLADTLIQQGDILSVIHLAEANLSGSQSVGTLFTVSLVVTDRPSGPSAIAAFSDSASKRLSSYTVLNEAGVTFAIESLPTLLYQDLPPVLAPPDSLVVPEDGDLEVDLADFGTDGEEPGQLVWSFDWDDAALDLVQLEDGIRIVPVKDYNGETTIGVTATDPSGNVSASDVRLHVTPTNDSPQILVATLPDTVRLDSGAVTIDLSGSAEDIDAGDVLTWSAEIEGPVQAVIQEGSRLKIFAPVTWMGSEPLLLQVVDASGSGGAVALTVFRAGAVTDAPGDFNDDGAVDFSDFVLFAKNYNQSGTSAIYDLDGDGQVGFSDFVSFVQVYGAGS